MLSSSKAAYLEIGDIPFNITSPESTVILEPDAFYKPFIPKISHHEAGLNFQVTLDLKEMPDTGSCAKLFDSEPLKVFKDNGYIISLHFPALDEPVRMASASEDFENILLYCSPYTLQQERLRTMIRNPVQYPLDQVILMLYLSDKWGGLLHAGGICLENRIYLFPGRSGAGKSTLCRQFDRDPDFTLVNDDRLLIRKVKESFWAYGTPWPGENEYTANIGLPVGGIFFINKSGENRIRPLNRRDAFEKLMPVMSIPWYARELVSDYIMFCEALVNQVPVCELSFKPDKNISHVFKEFISNR